MTKNNNSIKDKISDFEYQVLEWELRIALPKAHKDLAQKYKQEQENEG